MIKNYKLFKESLLDKLEGPSEEEIFKYFVDKKEWEEVFHYSVKYNNLKYFKLSLENLSKYKDLYGIHTLIKKTS